jgi:phenylalanyl-tRNA synthetase beta chain
MRVLHSWLRKFVDFDLGPETLADGLGRLGIEVERFDRLGKEYDGFVVGKVLAVERHPNADRLTVCRVKTGRETHQIVCGAPNVARDQKVVVGLPGAVVPRNQHDPSGKPFPLGKATIRGVESVGMICSEFELGLGQDADGIMVLEPGARPGTPLATLLNLADVAYDIEVTPNRPDLLGQVGVAREISVLTRKPLKLPKVRLREVMPPARTMTRVRVEDKAHCRRFGVRVLSGVRVHPSPDWLQRTLIAVGLRPVNNVVDVTNFVMMECGQPLHAFDGDNLTGGTLVVRQSEGGREFVTLDGTRVSVPEGTVMVCDLEKEVSIAGIMGGMNTQISDSTTRVVLEAAWWNPSTIRKTSRVLGIRTDASYRFERGADPNAVPYALDRAAALIAEVAGGSVHKGRVDVYPPGIRGNRIPLRLEHVNRVLGTDISERETVRLLAPLGIRCSAGKKGTVVCTVPTFRPDLVREIDLVEEVARVYGYDRIPEKVRTTITVTSHAPETAAGDRLRTALAGLGFREAITYPVTAERRAYPGLLTPVRILNPLSAEMDTLRVSLIPGLLSAVAHNMRHGSPDVRLFEIGRVFHRDPAFSGGYVEGFCEEEKAAVVISGRPCPDHWSRETREVDVFDLKGEVQALMGLMSLDKCRFISYSTSNSLVEEAIAIESNEGSIGYLGSVRNDVLSEFGIEGVVFVAELSVSAFTTKSIRKYVPLPKFPRVRRDVAFIVDETTPAVDVEQSLLGSSSGLLAKAELFDLFEGDPLPKGKKSLAFALEILSHERTLTDDEIEHEVEGAVRAVENKFRAILRRS